MRARNALRRMAARWWMNRRVTLNLWRANPESSPPFIAVMVIAAAVVFVDVTVGLDEFEDHASATWSAALAEQERQGEGILLWIETREEARN